MGIEGVGVEAPTDDATRVKTDQLGVEVRVDLLSTLGEDLRPPAHLDPADLLGRQHVVHHERRPTGMSSVAKLLALTEVMTADVDGV